MERIDRINTLHRLLKGARYPVSLQKLMDELGCSRATVYRDVAFLRDGRIVISEADPWARRGYELYGAAAESLGLHWGGRWRTLLDYGHVELRREGALRTVNAARAP